MLLSYHLPITDLRAFMPKKSGKLASPEWSYPLNKNKEAFIRGFGKVYNRNSEGFDYFSGGKEVCDIHSVIRFQSSDPQIVLPDNKIFKVDCKFRRFFVFPDSIGSNSKLEFGLTQKVKMSLDSDLISVEALLEGLSNLPITIRFPQPPHSSKAPKPLNRRELRESVKSTLGALGSNMSKALLHASTSARAGVRHKEWWIKVGEPMIFMEFSKEEPFYLPLHAKLLDCSNDDVDVYKFTLKNEWVSYIIKRKNHNKARSKSRALRIILSGLHCHISNMSLVLDSLEKDLIHITEGSKLAKKTEDYFNQEIGFIQKLIKSINNYNITGTQVEIPIPIDSARISALIGDIEKWKPIASLWSFSKIFKYATIEAKIVMPIPIPIITITLKSK